MWFRWCDMLSHKYAHNNIQKKFDLGSMRVQYLSSFQTYISNHSLLPQKGKYLRFGLLSTQMYRNAHKWRTTTTNKTLSIVKINDSPSDLVSETRRFQDEWSIGKPKHHHHYQCHRKYYSNVMEFGERESTNNDSQDLCWNVCVYVSLFRLPSFSLFACLFVCDFLQLQNQITFDLPSKKYKSR